MTAPREMDGNLRSVLGSLLLRRRVTAQTRKPANWAGNIFTSRFTRYRDFVRGGIRVESPWDKLRGEVSLGVDDFVDRLTPCLEESEELRRILTAQYLADRPGLGGVGGQSRQAAAGS